MIVEWVNTLYYSIIFGAPAFIANAVPVFVSGLGRIDRGLKLKDGKALLGSHKTNGGLISAVLVGLLVGLVAPLYFPEIFYESELEGYQLFIGPLMGFGAILGDAIGSFVKRRINIKPGAPFPIVDQIGFIFVAFILAEIFVNIPSTWWWVIPFTLVLHIGSNLIAYFFGWKEVWY